MNLDKQYLDLLNDILITGTKKSDRTGTGTISIFGQRIVHNMKDGFPLLTTKKLHFKSIAHELLWFLKGDTNVKYLNDNGVTIWNEWADKEGNLGPVYGHQWVNWNSTNQIQKLIDDLKTNPDSRRLLVSAWNVSDLDKMALVPCHYSFQLYTRELNFQERYDLYLNVNTVDTDELKTNEFFDEYNIPKKSVSLIWNQRSCDFFLGIPYNIASYGLLLHMIGHCVNMVPEKLVGSFGDTHLYSNHIEQAKEQLSRDPNTHILPKFRIKTSETDIFKIKYEDLEIINYQAYPNIKAPIAI